MKRTVFWVAAGGGFGSGHLARTMSVARALPDGHESLVLVPSNALTADMAIRRGAPAHRTRLMHRWDEAEAVVQDVVSAGWEGSPDLLVTDRPDALSAGDLARLRAAWPGTKIAVVGNEETGPLAVDLQILPDPGFVLNAPGNEVWRTYPGQCIGGAGYCVLGRRFQRRAPRPLGKPPHILVTTGRTDPTNLTLLFVSALSALNVELAATVVIGSGFVHEESLPAILDAADSRFHFVRSTDNLEPLMGESDLALCAFGITLQELAAVGVPALSVCRISEDVYYGRRMATLNFMRFAGYGGAMRPAQLRDELRHLLASPKVLEGMAAAGPKHIDGHGAERVAQALATLAEKRQAGVS